MSELRLNPLTGRWVTIAVERATRPADFASRTLEVEDDPGRPCPFCPGNEEATPPALETYGPGGDWLVRVVPNLYPAFSGSETMAVKTLGPVFTQAQATGIHEVLVFSPEHGATWADLDDKQAGLVMAALRDRIEDHSRLSAVRYTQAIVNEGREAGASLEHGHGQLLGIPFVPGEIADEEAGFRRFAGSECLLCTVAEAERDVAHRIVIETDRVLVTCPFWSGTPYEMLVIPKEHGTHLHETPPQDLVAVGRALRDALDLLRKRIPQPPYNVMFHTAPHGHDGPFHWHVHVLPRLSTSAGFEAGTGVLINIVPPEVAASQLRDGTA